MVTDSYAVCLDPADGSIRAHKSILRCIICAPRQHLLDCRVHSGSVFRVNPGKGIFHSAGKRIASKPHLAVSLVRPSHGFGRYVPIPQSDLEASCLCQLQPLLPFYHLLFWITPTCHAQFLPRTEQRDNPGEG